MMMKLQEQNIQPSFNSHPQEHRIVIQDLMTKLNRPIDEKYVLSSQDHSDKNIKIPAYQPRSKPLLQKHMRDSGKGASPPLSDYFQIPQQDNISSAGEDETLLLNARQLKHYSFFKRVYEKLYLLWSSELGAQKILWKYSSEGNYLTRIRLQMNELGYLTHTNILLSSGIEWIDKSAINALRKAEPFPNPPKDYQVPHSSPITFEFIYEFLFILNKKGGFNYQLYRSPGE
jgi:TonB family protein